VASASADGAPYLAPLSFAWDGEALLMATPTDSPTRTNLAAVLLEAGQIEQATPTETARAGPSIRWRHDEHGHEDGHAVACAARCR
jgi:hypothetical protein